jgi:hypothetical protein
MQIRIKNGQDFATGLLFLIVGIGAYYIGSSYSMGVAQRPGTGVLPRILAWCLIGSGILMWIKAFFGAGEGSVSFSWRPIVMPLLGIALLLLLLQLGAGPIISMTGAMTVAAIGMPGTPWRPLVMITLAVMAFSLLIDSAGLIAAMVATMTLAALGTHETRWREFAGFAVLMLAIGYGLFIYGLGMPIKVWPWN